MSDTRLKWRLILGSAAGSPTEYREIDASLATVYDGERSASLDPSAPGIPADLPAWLARIRELFPSEMVAVIQRDAIEQKNWSKLLFEPETLARLEPDLELARVILAAKDRIPDRSRDLARALVRRVAGKLRARLETGLRSSIVGALRRNRRSPAGSIDWPRTIARNLRHWQPDRKILVPERLHFAGRERRRRDWKVILLVDQSASMATSVIHSSVVASVLASLDVVRTHLVLFDTSVVDMTRHLADPVEILFGARLGGGTDIARAVEYASSLIETPERTILAIVSDLHEAGDRDALLRRLRAHVESRVKLFCVLALTDEGAAAFDSDLARDVADAGVRTFACTPGELVEAIAGGLR